MGGLLQITLIGLFFGTFGTTLGGIIGVCLKNATNKFLGFILSLAAGLMISIVCFDLIPESLALSNIGSTLIGIIIGIVSMIFCDVFVERKLSKKLKDKGNTLLKTGIIISIGLALHNFPEGLAIGSGFEASKRLGYSLAIAIALHDIPEGISMAIPMRVGGVKVWRVILYVALSGVTTGVGALFGGIIGVVSQGVISICLSFAAGAMLYIVSGELLPESNKLYNGRMNAIGNIIGFIIGLFA